MTETTILALAVATLAQALFCVSVLMVKALNSPKHLLLAGIFVTICFASGGPAIETFAPERLQQFYYFTLPAYLLMPPLLWFYTGWLTAERPWQMKRRHWRQFAPALLAFAIIVTEILLFPDGKLSQVTIEDAPVGIMLFYALLGMVHFLLFLSLIPQSALYLFLIAKRLTKYRSRLKNHFASNEGRGLEWFVWFLAVFVLVWIAALLTILAQNVGGAKIMPREVGAALFLLLVWSLGLLGLSQRPGFEGEYLDDADEELTERDGSEDAPESEKYQRSALTDERADRIAARIRMAMERDQLYLDPTLSLNKLSKHIAVSPNHISQTLNETMGECFFDYVNGWRVRSAEPQILANEKTVLEIALEVGFNARSSFYKAFKRETGKTPGEYRKAVAA